MMQEGLVLPAGQNQANDSGLAFRPPLRPVDTLPMSLGTPVSYPDKRPFRLSRITSVTLSFPVLYGENLPA